MHAHCYIDRNFNDFHNKDKLPIPQTVRAPL